jgi:hypothetical protein
MKITTTNYFDKIEEVGFENLPSVLKQSHQVILTKTNKGENWDLYKSDKDLKSMIDLTFKKLEEYVDSGTQSLSGLRGEDRYNESLRMELVSLKNDKVASEDKLALNAAMDYIAIWEIGKLKKSLLYDFTWPMDYSPIEADIHHSALRIFAISGKHVDKAFEIKELFRYFNQHYNPKTYKFNFVKDAWRYIPEKYRTPNSKPYELDFVYRFIYFNNKTVLRKEIHDYLEDLQSAIKAKKIRKTSVLANEIMEIQKLLIPLYNQNKINQFKIVFKKETEDRFRNAIGYDNPKQLLKFTDYYSDKKKISPLSGLKLQETKTEKEPNIMPSTDFANLKFNTIGFQDKWLSFIGDPAPGFTVMVFGMPKMGKSYLCIEFAGYLARNHGKVLYVAKEEKLDKTLQDKLNEKNVAHENLSVADGIPSDLSAYNFIFLDSVNKLGLSPKDLEKLKAENKGKSFVYIFQATKGGFFKGNNEFQHDVDVVIEVPERGKATQYGRFNQGGEMNIFPEILKDAA